MFTLSGGHVFPLYDAVVKDDAGPAMRLVDVRHEQSAVFAAEGLAKLTRTPGLACRRASSMALLSAAGAGMVPLSPAPLKPSGLASVGVSM